jgi:hypothetical protein
MQSAAALAATDGACELWVQHSDRLARGDGKLARHVVEIALWAIKADVKIRSLQDPDTFRDLLYAVVSGQRNHEDSKRKGAAVEAGTRRAAERGDWPGGVRLDGYRLALSLDARGQIQRKAEFDPARQPIIEELFRLARMGLSGGEIAARLNGAGWRTAARISSEPARTFHALHVLNSLKNARYAGLIVYKGEAMGEGNWPRFISPRMFRQLAREREIRGRVAQRSGHVEHPRAYLLRRLARCGLCGNPMYGHTYTNRANVIVRRYICKQHLQIGGPCPAPRMDADLIEQTCIAQMQRLLAPAALVPALLLADPDGVPSSIPARDLRREARVALAEADEGAVNALLDELILDRQTSHLELPRPVTAPARPRAVDQNPETELRQLNEALRDQFSHIVLTSTPAGIKIAPVLV